MTAPICNHHLFQKALNNDLQSPEKLIPKNRGFKIACLNITSRYKHIDELRICLNDREVDTLAINETRLGPDSPKELIYIYGYNWRDRNRHVGGIGFYIRDALNYRVRSDQNNTDIEVLTILKYLNMKPNLSS